MSERRHIKVLLIEDNQADVRLIWEILSEVRNSPFYLEVADTLKSGLEAIDKNMPDVILLDLSLPDSNGIYTLNRIRDRAKERPVVIITGLDDEVTAMKALKEGAQDYLVKGRTDSDLLKRALIYSIERNNLLIELEKHDSRMKESVAELERFNKEKNEFISRVAGEFSGQAESIKEFVDFVFNRTDCELPEDKREKLKEVKNITDNIMKNIEEFKKDKGKE